MNAPSHSDDTLRFVGFEPAYRLFLETDLPPFRESRRTNLLPPSRRYTSSRLNLTTVHHPSVDGLSANPQLHTPMNSSHKLLLPFLLTALNSPAWAVTSATSLANLEFSLTFDASTDFKIQTFSLPITGSLAGEGNHEERWGLSGRAGRVTDSIPNFEYSLIDDPVNLSGPFWGTQTLTTANSVSLSMLTMADAHTKPSSFASAKSSAIGGTIATVMNQSTEPKAFFVTVARDITADVAAVAEPGEYAFAEADWDFSFSQILGASPSVLFKDKGDINAYASQESSKPKDSFRVSSVFEDYAKQGTFKVWLGAGETTTFKLDHASLYSHAVVATPEGGSILWTFSATLGLFALMAGKKGVARRSV
jgi:hypothetical protein